MWASQRIAFSKVTRSSSRSLVPGSTPRAKHVRSKSYNLTWRGLSPIQHCARTLSPVCVAAAYEVENGDEKPSWQFLSDEEVDDLLADAAGFISVLDDLRPLDPAAYNPFYEVWTRIARIPPEERYRLLDELDPGSLRTLWRASMSRYVLDEVYTYEGRCESYQLGGQGAGGAGGVRLERVAPPGAGVGMGSMGNNRLVPSWQISEGGGSDPAAASVPSTTWLRPHVGAPELRASTFKQIFFVPLLPPPSPSPSLQPAGQMAAAEEVEEGAGVPLPLLAQSPPRIYSRVVLPLAGPLDRWWEPLYGRLRVQLVLTPLARDAGADLQLLYPDDPAAAEGEGEGEGDGGREGRGAASSGAPGSGPGGGRDGPGAGGWALWGPECLPPPLHGWGGGWSGWWRWPDPDPATYGKSPFSGGPRDYLRVAGPGVYVGCAYREGPGPGELREENFVYFLIVRKYGYS
uniref:MT0045f n=1 Tax=Volvox carteri f. nagariensis TaxID=3068 RepID=D9CIX0_VOLCA|nr:MT0045f [Volvox carteri f. nagariensis]